VASEVAGLEVMAHELHRAPELSNQEVNTAARLAGELERAGFTVTREVGGHGVVGVLSNGAGPTLLIRTDMDALPVTEESGVPWASTVHATDSQGRDVGVMHACGHDIHMSVFVGTARVLAHVRQSWRGTLVMIGQGAEEKGTGAKAMLDAGLFSRFPRPDFCLAEHVIPTLPAGTVGYVECYAFANVDSVDVVMRGVGGHGASPHTTRDPVVMAAELVMALQTIVSREMEPTDPAVVTVGSIHGGTAYNIIPDEVALQLTVRSYSAAARRTILAAIERIARGIAAVGGVPADRMPSVTLGEGSIDAVYNDPALAQRVGATLRTALGADRVVVLKPEMIGEDFGSYGLVEPRIPILMLRVGTGDTSPGPARRLHSSHYAPAAARPIATAVTAMAAAALEVLRPAGH
jgi:amidohydrolase